MIIIIWTRLWKCAITWQSKFWIKACCIYFKNIRKLCMIQKNWMQWLNYYSKPPCSLKFSEAHNQFAPYTTFALLNYVPFLPTLRSGKTSARGREEKRELKMICSSQQNHLQISHTVLKVLYLYVIRYQWIPTSSPDLLILACVKTYFVSREPHITVLMWILMLLSIDNYTISLLKYHHNSPSFHRVHAFILVFSFTSIPIP